MTTGYRGNGVGGHVVNGQQIQPGAVDYSKLSASAQASLAGFRNKIINGNFDIWQRGTSFSAATGFRFTTDRWLSNAIGSTIATSLQAFTLGQTDVPGNPKNFIRHVVASVAGAGNVVIFGQRIEGVQTFAGQKATLSFYAKADAAKSIALNLGQNFGTGGSPSAAVGGIAAQKVSLTTNWQRFVVPIDVPSISGKTLGTNGDDFLIASFYFDAGSSFNADTNNLGQQAGTFDIARVQLEVGSDATPFAERPLQQETSLCQRFYCVGGGLTIPGNSPFNGYTTYMSVFFQEAMRTTPTITPSWGGDSGNISAKGTTGVSTNGFQFSLTTSGTGNFWGGVNSWAASAEL